MTVLQQPSLKTKGGLAFETSAGSQFLDFLLEIERRLEIQINNFPQSSFEKIAQQAGFQAKTLISLLRQINVRFSFNLEIGETLSPQEYLSLFKKAIGLINEIGVPTEEERLAQSTIPEKEKLAALVAKMEEESQKRAEIKQKAIQAITKQYGLNQEEAEKAFSSLCQKALKEIQEQAAKAKTIVSASQANQTAEAIVADASQKAIETLAATTGKATAEKIVSAVEAAKQTSFPKTVLEAVIAHKIAQTGASTPPPEEIQETAGTVLTQIKKALPKLPPDKAAAAAVSLLSSPPDRLDKTLTDLSKSLGLSQAEATALKAINPEVVVLTQAATSRAFAVVKEIYPDLSPEKAEAIARSFGKLAFHPTMLSSPSLGPPTSDPGFEAAVCLVLAKHEVPLPDPQKGDLFKSLSKALSGVSSQIPKEIPQEQATKVASEEIEKSVLAILKRIPQLPTSAQEAAQGAAHAFAKSLTLPQTPLSQSFFQMSRLEATPPAGGDPLAALSQIGSRFSLASFAGKFTLIDPRKLQEWQKNWGKFTEILSRLDPTRGPANSLIHLGDCLFGNGGVVPAVLENPLYQKFSGIVRFAQNLNSKGLLKFLAKTSVGKAISGFSQKIAQKAATWFVGRLAKKIGEEAVKKSTELIAKGLIKEGIKAAIASAIGISSAGVGFLIWGGLELLGISWKIFKKALNWLKTREWANFFTFGLNEKIRDAFNRFNIIPIVGKWLADFLNNNLAPILDIISGVAIPTIVVPIAAAIIICLCFIFGFPLLTNSIFFSLHPPSQRGGEAGIPEGSLSELFPFETNDEFCAGLSNHSARIACTLYFALNDSANPSCNLGGRVTTTTIEQVARCLEASITLQERGGNAQEIVETFRRSLVWDGTLQCVGFKRAVEPNLPVAPNGSDANDFYNFCQGSSQCQIVSSNQIQPGDNAIWTAGAYGHIAIVLGRDPNNNENVTVAQAWGGSGKISLTSVPIVSVSQFIRVNH